MGDEITAKILKTSPGGQLVARICFEYDELDEMVNFFNSVGIKTKVCV